MDSIVIEFSPCDKGKVLNAIRGMGNVTGNYGDSELLLATNKPLLSIGRKLHSANLENGFYIRMRVD